MTPEQNKQHNLRYSNPYADYEYIGKGSRQPWRTLVLPLIFGFGLWLFAFVRWREITTAEQTGSVISMTSLEWGLYKISGKWGFVILFSALGAMFIYLGIQNYRRLEKMKKS
jgi:hypothetical protein